MGCCRCCFCSGLLLLCVLLAGLFYGLETGLFDGSNSRNSTQLVNLRETTKNTPTPNPETTLAPSFLIVQDYVDEDFLHQIIKSAKDQENYAEDEGTIN
ncbi:unnamed protein product [Caenorhabditis auriculariae]|uniref:Uncharacterized protein n=1 Tax=Caenorhabditis auriculariae TaxID=2777116 RepID=A0A8S1GRT5_9PELO|nr:unnamed protein product [Caenorhabditis auriculariae]